MERCGPPWGSRLAPLSRCGTLKCVARSHRTFRRALCAVFLCASGCSEEPAKPPAPPGQTAGVSVSVGGGAEGDTGQAGDSSDSGSSGQTGGGQSCSPLGDPLQECGQGQECSFGDRKCHASAGTATVGQPCTVTDPELLLDDCQAALVCAYSGSVFGRCLEPCEDPSDCAAGLSCVLSHHENIPGLCIASCDPFLQNCTEFPAEACYPLPLMGGESTGGCLPVGTGDVDSECTIPNDCQASMTCTVAALHTSGCNGAESCCTPLCDVEIQDCLGVDSICYTLGNPMQPRAGFCGSP